MSRILPFIAATLVAAPAFGQLRIVTLNASNYNAASAQPRNGMSTILSAIGATISDDPRLAGNSGIARPIDVLCLQEVFTPATTGAGYAALLNQIYATNTYSFGTMTGATTGNGTQGIVYNTATVQLLGEAAVGTTSGSGMARQQVRHRIRPVGYSSSTADIYIYNGHWKSSSSDAARRLVEAQTIKSNAAGLPANSNVIYLGDMNVFTSSESGYAHLLGGGEGQAFDPINAPGNWNDTSSFRNVHTQSPWDSALNPGFNGATGGMDSRFDQQLVTGNLNDGEGVAYISNSYFVLGNNGSHQLGQPLNTGTGAAPAVLAAESSILDHLPVSVDYQLPAKMAVTQTAAAPPRVIVGAAATATFRVENTAPTTFINGADELDYAMSVSGPGTGSISSSAQATTGGNQHNVAFHTAAVGIKNLTVNFASASQAVENGGAGLDITTQVLAHSTPSFEQAATATTRTIDFGIRARGESIADSISLFNRADPSGFTAGLDVDQVNGSGDTATLGLNLATGNGSIDPGAGREGAVAFDSAAVGSFAASYSLLPSDEDIPGAAGFAPLTLNLVGRIALGGDADLNNTVDIGDFALLAANFNTAGPTWESADFNHDGMVDIADFSVLAANFNTTAGVLPRSSIPEPAGATAIVVGLVLVHRRRAVIGRAVR